MSIAVAVSIAPISIERRCSRPNVIFVLWRNVNQIVSSQIRHGEFSKNVIYNAGGHFNVIVMLNDPIGFKACKRKLMNEFFERNAILKSGGDGNRKTVHEASKRRTFLMHI